MRQPHEYKLINFWGVNSGSFRYYIRQQQLLAAMDNAPLNAVFKEGSNWVTIDDVQNQSVVEHAKSLGLVQDNSGGTTNDHS